MKLFAFLMASLVLLLSVQPCADDETNNSSTNQTVVTKDSHHEDTESHTDNCTPFCHCSCCASVSIDHMVTTIAGLFIYRTHSFTPGLSSDLLHMSIPVWQPPKLEASLFF